MSRLILKDLVKKFDNVAAVNHVRLEVEEGEFVPSWGLRVVARRPPSAQSRGSTSRMRARFTSMTSS